MKPTVSPPAYCLPTFFVDGHEWSPTMGPPVDLTPGRAAEGPYTPTNVKAVEIYPPERARPLRFTGDPTCGAIVIWTKQSKRSRGSDYLNSGSLPYGDV
jgi:hypothetical protein